MDETEGVTATVFDINDTILDTVTLLSGDPGTGDGIATLIAFNATDVVRLLLTPLPSSDGGIGWGFDNLTYDTVSLTVPVDIKPQSCPNPVNVKSKGVLPVAILGTADFDVNDIDVSTIELEGVAPMRDNVEDVAAPFNGPTIANCLDCTVEGPDGFDDLILHFRTQDVVDNIGSVDDGACLKLTITGELLDGTPFQGEDVVIILKKGNNQQENVKPQTEQIQSSFSSGVSVIETEEEQKK